MPPLKIAAPPGNLKYLLYSSTIFMFTFFTVIAPCYIIHFYSPLAFILNHPIFSSLVAGLVFNVPSPTVL